MGSSCFLTYGVSRSLELGPGFGFFGIGERILASELREKLLKRLDPVTVI